MKFDNILEKFEKTELKGFDERDISKHLITDASFRGLPEFVAFNFQEDSDKSKYYFGPKISFNDGSHFPELIHLKKEMIIH